MKPYILSSTWNVNRTIMQPEYASLRTRFEAMLAKRDAQWKPMYHFSGCSIHPNADTLVESAGGFSCAVCAWNEWIYSREFQCECTDCK